MEFPEVQTRILRSEFDAFGRLGVERTSKNKTPIISHILIPLIEDEQEEKMTRSDLFSMALADNAISAFEFRILTTLFLIDDAAKPTNATKPTSVEDRISEICTENNISTDNLRRRIRPRIVDKIANYFGNKYHWIMLQKENNQTFPYPNNISEFIDGNADRLCRSYRYSVQIEKQEAAYDVITDYQRLRVLPSTDVFHVYICRTYESMQTAVKDNAIVGLELAELSQKEWTQYAGDFECSLTLADEFVPAKKVRKTDEFLVFKFTRPAELSDKSDWANIICHYKLGAHVTRFPVKLINHFTTGGVAVDFSIKGGGISDLQYADYFAGFDGVSPLLERSVNVKRFPPSTGINGVSISVPPNTLIFPGAGVEFFWEIN